VDVNWLSGFDYLGQIFARSWHAPVCGGIRHLWLAGCILGLAFARTRALYLSMGIHAGWVFTLKNICVAHRRRVARGHALVWPVLLAVLWLCWKKL